MRFLFFFPTSLSPELTSKGESQEADVRMTAVLCLVNWKSHRLNYSQRHSYLWQMRQGRGPTFPCFPDS